MDTLAKWVWIIILIIFFGGTEIFYVIGASVIVGLLIAWLKLEWYDKF